MAWLSSWWSAVWHPTASSPPPTVPTLQNGQREAQLRAIKLHQDRLLSDLHEILDPNTQRLVQSLMDDERYRHVKPDD